VLLAILTRGIILRIGAYLQIARYCPELRRRIPTQSRRRGAMDDGAVRGGTRAPFRVNRFPGLLLRGGVWRGPVGVLRHTRGTEDSSSGPLERGVGAGSPPI